MSNNYLVDIQQLGVQNGFKETVTVPASDDVKAGISAINQIRKAYPKLTFLTARNIRPVEEKSLKEQMNPTDAERALNIAKLTDEKLKVVEARLSGISKDFREITANAVDRVKADARNELLQTINEQVRIRVDSRHLDNDAIHLDLQNSVDNLTTAVKQLGQLIKDADNQFRERDAYTNDRIDVILNRIRNSFFLKWLFNYVRWFDLDGQLNSDKREL